MKKIIKLNIITNIVPIFTFILLEFLYFCYGVNSRSVLYPPIIQLPSKMTECIITRLVLLLIEVSASYLILTAKHSKIADCSIAQLLKCLLPILVIRIVFDIALFAPMPITYIKLLQLILDTIYIFCLFAAISKRTLVCSQKCKFAKKQKILCVVILVIMILMLFYIITSNKNNIKTIDYYSNKYASIIPNILIKNINFKDDVFIALYFCAINITMYFFYGSTKSENIQHSERSGEIFKVIVRCILIVFCFAILFVVKVWFFPFGIISRISIDKTNVAHYSKDVNFNTIFTELSIYRISNSDTESCCFSNHQVHILYGNDRITKLNRNVMFDSDKLIDIHSNLHIYNNQAILLLIDNEPVVYMTKDINKHKNTPELTAALKQIIGCGYFEYLELSYDYMLLNSPDYLETVLLEYKNGKFSEKNEHLNTEYINNFVDSALKRDFT